MPDFLKAPVAPTRPLPEWARVTGRTAMVMAYVFGVVAGVIGLTWPPDYALSPFAIIATRGAGAVIMAASTLLVWTQIKHRWKVEMLAIPWVGIGMIAYMMVVLIDVGPAREWILFISTIGMVLSGLAARRAWLEGKVERRAAARWWAQRGAA